MGNTIFKFQVFFYGKKKTTLPFSEI